MTRKTKAKILSHEIKGRTLIVNVELKIPFYTHATANNKLKRLRENLKTPLLQHICDWADWGQEYSIELFADMLIQLGKSLIKYGHLVHSVRNGRRAIFAGRRLKRLIEWGDFYYMPDKSIDNHYSRITHKNVPLDDGMILWQPVYLYDNAMQLDRETYHTKLGRVITKRLKDKFEQEWGDTWSYIQKYSRQWWD